MNMFNFVMGGGSFQFSLSFSYKHGSQSTNCRNSDHRVHPHRIPMPSRESPRILKRFFFPSFMWMSLHGLLKIFLKTKTKRGRRGEETPPAGRMEGGYPKGGRGVPAIKSLRESSTLYTYIIMLTLGLVFLFKKFILNLNIIFGRSK